MDADGGHRRRLTTNIQGDFQPSWSPDGQYIAFISFDRHIDSSSVMDGIFRMDSDGSHMILLIDHGTDPTWSTDGTRIMFVDGPSISFMNKDGAQITHLPGYLLPANPSWQP